MGFVTDSLKSRLEKIKDLELRYNEPMSNHTSFRVGGPADVFAIANSSDALVELYRLTCDCDVRFFLIGNGTNLLFSDEGFRGVVTKLGDRFSWTEFDGDLVSCGAALPLSRIARESVDRELSGLEFAFGIPGTVGGGIRMNAGAHSHQLAEVIEWVEVITFDGKRLKVGRDELGFGYRESRLGEFLCATGAAFRLHKAERWQARRRMDAFWAERRMKQPLGFASAGCVFKNPPDISAGALIERCGLKGLQIGGAMVSMTHANFIVNIGTANASDILQLIRRVRDEVKGKTGIELQLEIEYVE
jgi:UDP-N-acetylmuramate dehydrogenase